MAVYVDDMEAQYRGMTMCHMLADTTAELLAMAEAIGVDTKWIQKRGTAEEHFDIALTKRRQAVKAGAVQVTQRDMVSLIQRKREEAQRGGERAAGAAD